MTEPLKERPKVGMGVIVLRGGKILIGERTGNHGAGTSMIPGGHLEFGESFEDAAKREVEEETGLKDLHDLKLVSIGNDIAYDKHYVSIVFTALSDVGKPYDAEPEKCGNWKWLDPSKIPDTIFLPSKKALENWQKGIQYRGNN